MDRFDDGILIQCEVQRLGSAAGGQQRLMGMGLFEALHQTGPRRRDSGSQIWILVKVALPFKHIHYITKSFGTLAFTHGNFNGFNFTAEAVHAVKKCVYGNI